MRRHHQSLMIVRQPRRHLRLRFKNVQRRAPNDAFTQRRQQIIFLDDGATRRVDEAGGRFHLAQSVQRKQMARFRRERHVDADKVALAQQLWQGRFLGTESLINGRFFTVGCVQNLHAKTQRPTASHRRANAPHPHNA